MAGSTTVCWSGAVSAALVAVLFARWWMSRSSSFEPSRPPSASAVLITGGSRGIGRSTADHLLRRGYTVFVTVRKQAQVDELLAGGGDAAAAPHPILMDVTDDDDMGPAVEAVSAALKKKNGVKLVAIVNNAGINPEGDAMAKAYAAGEEPENVLADPSVASRVLDTNVVGVARVTRAFLPLLSEGEGGRVVNIGSYFGSIAGKAGLSHAYYEASKFALEGLSDNFRRSLRGRGISVSLIKPGNIVTDMNKAFGEAGPEVVARDVEHAVGAPNPRARYYPGTVKGTPVSIACRIFELLPTWLVDKL